MVCSMFSEAALLFVDGQMWASIVLKSCEIVPLTERLAL